MLSGYFSSVELPREPEISYADGWSTAVDFWATVSLPACNVQWGSMCHCVMDRWMFSTKRCHTWKPPIHDMFCAVTNDKCRHMGEIPIDLCHTPILSLYPFFTCNHVQICVKTFNFTRKPINHNYEVKKSFLDDTSMYKRTWGWLGSNVRWGWLFLWCRFCRG